MSTTLLAALVTDGYKTFHGSAIHEDITRMYGNFTNRSGRLSNLPNDDLGGVVAINIQATAHTLQESWRKTFFEQNKYDVTNAIKRILDAYLGIDYDVRHYCALWDLGRLPITIKGVPEGTIVPYGVAPYTVQTSVDGFQWLALYIETFLSASTWHSNTNATTAAYFMLQAKRALKKADLDETMLPFMIHDFSMRGLDIEAAGRLGYAHLAVGHCGSDTLPAIFYAEDNYGANVDNELVACSVKATEHSITTSFIMTYAEDNDCSLFEAEIVYARKLLKENPTGILSYVADSFDFWRFVTEGLDLLKDDIMARDGTFVIRPDSGKPADVLCGTDSTAIVLEGKYIDNSSLDSWKSEVVEDIDMRFRNDLDAENPMCSMSLDYIYDGTVYCVTYEPDLNRHDKTYYYVDNYGDDAEKCTFQPKESTPEGKGLIQILAEKFGTTDNGTVRSLDSHIGAIYGDSITVQVQQDIYTRLIAKGLSPIVVLGVGSYSYQYVTRDTHGSAVKCTAAFKADGTVVDVCKDPKTDPGKKSAKGLLFIYRDEDDTIKQADGESGVVTLNEQVGQFDGVESIYITYMEDGLPCSSETLAGTRKLVAEQLAKLV